MASDGSQACRIEKTYEGADPASFGRDCAREILAGEGALLMAEIRKTLPR